MSLPSVLLTRSGVLRLGSGHPWIYADHVASAEVEAGLVRLEGPAGRARGVAVFNAASRMPVRVVSRSESELPPDWWQARLDRALAQRIDQWAIGEPAARLVHAEADGLPGLIVDRYGGVAVVQAGCLWADEVARAVARRLIDEHGLTGVLARHDGAFRRPEGLPEGVEVLAGEVPDSLELAFGTGPAGSETVVRREVAPHTGQKTGTFLDQRENQRWAGQVLPAGRMLDVFSCDGGFALHLAAAGNDVMAIDSSASALGRLERLAAAQDLAGTVTTHRANAFEDLRERVRGGEQFDAIVLDPPALAKKRGDLARAQRAYKEVNLRALRLLRGGGRLVTCSCSAHLSRDQFLELLGAAAADAGRDVTIMEQRGAAACHPWRADFPESAYLKVALLEVRGG